MTASLCTLEECDVAEFGKCHLGHDPVETCPNYAADVVDIDEVSPAEGTFSASLPGPTAIVSGDVMHIDELEAFGRARKITTVALVGERKAGKTTLLASLYAMFLKGRPGTLQFAGSVTLVGFAKRHYLALLSSGRPQPTTPRTSRDDPPSFYHLALLKDRVTPVDLVIADRSGEAYGDARVTTDLIDDLPELRQADRICFLLDGARLASKETRGPYARQFKQLIHALRDNKALANAKAIEVITTKLDTLNKLKDAKERLSQLDDYERALIAEFAERGLNIQCFRICALPKQDLNLGFVGLQEAIERWTAASEQPNLRPVSFENPQRQIDRLLAKPIGEDA